MFKHKGHILIGISLFLLPVTLFAQDAQQHIIDDLPDALRNGFIGLEVWQWLAILALIVLSLIVGVVVPWLIGKTIGLRKRLTSQEIAEGHAKTTKRALGLFATALVLSLGLPSLLLEDHIEDGAKQVLLVLRILTATYVFVTLWEVGCDIFDAKAQKASRRERNLILPFARRFGQAAVIIFGSVAVAASVGFNVAGLIAGLGIGGLVLALAAKNSVENVFGSITVVLDMPFMIGDWIKMGDLDGVVEEINLRSTRLRTAQDSLIVIPNSNLITASIENFGARRYRRLKLSLTVSAVPETTILQKFTDGLRKLAKDNETIRDGSDDISLYDITAQGVIVQFSCLLEAKSVQEELVQREAVLISILKLAQDLGISLLPAASASPPEPPKPSKSLFPSKDPLD